MSDEKTNQLGVEIEYGTRITHGNAGNVKKPFSEMSVIMHELYTGHDNKNALSFSGQFGFIEFNTQCRLPRHIHMMQDKPNGEYRLLPERILVLNGVGITELSGKYYVVAPGTLVDIAPGVPHTWNACPAGVVLPDGTVSDGTFTMVYNYSEETSFFPTKETTTITSADQYQAFEGNLEEIRFPDLSLQDVLDNGILVWDNTINTDLSRFL